MTCSNFSLKRTQSYWDSRSAGPGLSILLAIAITYVNCRIEAQTLTGQTYTAIELELREYFIARAFDADGTKKRGKRLADARNATCRKLTELVFRELYNEVK